MGERMELTRQQKHDVLLDKWEKQYSDSDRKFVRDGVFDWQSWEKASPRILFLLKETPNEYDTKDTWSVMDLWKDYLDGMVNTESKYHKRRFPVALKRMMYWTFAVNNLFSDHLSYYHKIKLLNKNNKHDLYHSLIKNTSVVNINKNAGSNRTNMEKLKENYNLYKKFVHNQIDILAPDLVVCGYTFNIINNSLFGKDKIEYVSDLVYIYNHNTIVVNYWHPSNRYPDFMNYHTLLSVLRTACNYNKTVYRILENGSS